MAVVTLHHDDTQLVEILKARCEKSCAERDAAHALLARYVNYVRRIGGFMEHEDQEMQREGTAMLVEHGWRHGH